MTHNTLVSFSLILYGLIGLSSILMGFFGPGKQVKAKKIFWIVLGVLVLVTVLITWSYIHGLEAKFVNLTTL